MTINRNKESESRAENGKICEKNSRGLNLEKLREIFKGYYPSPDRGVLPPHRGVPC